MRNCGLLLLAVLMVTGCSDDDSFDFRGTWLLHHEVIDQTCGWQPLSGRMKISVSRGEFAVQFLDSADTAPHIARYMNPTGFLEYEYLQLRFISPAGVTQYWSAHERFSPPEDGGMEGSSYANDTSGRCNVSTHWTAELISR